MACANNRLEIFEMTMEEDAKDDDEGKDQIQKQLVRLKPTAQFDCQFGGIGLRERERERERRIDRCYGR